MRAFKMSLIAERTMGIAFAFAFTQTIIDCKYT
jgi:hypothetical protein